MTGTSSTTGTASTTNDPVAAQVDQLLALLKRRKVLWEFHTGTSTNQSTTGAASVGVLLDGDTEAVNAVTLMGPIKPSSRVSVIFVPPTGYYVIGYLGGAPQLGVIERVTGVASGTGGIGTTEVADSAIPNLVFSADGSTIVRITLAGRGLTPAVAAGGRFLVIFRDGFAQPPTISPPSSLWGHSSSINMVTVGNLHTMEFSSAEVPSAGLHTVGVSYQLTTGGGGSTVTPQGTFEFYAEAIGTI